MEIYKKEDPSEQSFHTTDVSRYNFLTMLNTIFKNNITLKKNNNKHVNVAQWKEDKKGVQLKETVIRPYLYEIQKIYNEYINCNSNYKSTIKFEQIDDSDDSNISYDSDDSNIPNDKNMTKTYTLPKMNFINLSEDQKNNIRVKLAEINGKINDHALEKDICKILAPQFQLVKI